MEKKLMLDAKRVVVVHLNNILLCPPVIQLVDNLLSNGHVVYLVSSHITELPERLLGHPCLQYTDIPRPNGNSLTDNLYRWRIRSKISKATVKRYMEQHPLASFSNCKICEKGVEDGGAGGESGLYTKNMVESGKNAVCTAK